MSSILDEGKRWIAPLCDSEPGLLRGEASQPFGRGKILAVKGRLSFVERLLGSRPQRFLSGRSLNCAFRLGHSRQRTPLGALRSRL